MPSEHEVKSSSVNIHCKKILLDGYAANHSLSTVNQLTPEARLYMSLIWTSFFRFSLQLRDQ
jgi:hypothetical protein